MEIYVVWIQRDGVTTPEFEACFTTLEGAQRAWHEWSNPLKRFITREPVFDSFEAVSWIYNPGTERLC